MRGSGIHAMSGISSEAFGNFRPAPLGGRAAAANPSASGVVLAVCTERLASDASGTP